METLHLQQLGAADHTIFKQLNLDGESLCLPEVTVKDGLEDVLRQLAGEGDAHLVDGEEVVGTRRAVVDDVATQLVHKLGANGIQI